MVHGCNYIEQKGASWYFGASCWCVHVWDWEVPWVHSVLFIPLAVPICLVLLGTLRPTMGCISWKVFHPLLIWIFWIVCGTPSLLSISFSVEVLICWNYAFVISFGWKGMLGVEWYVLVVRIWLIQIQEWSFTMCLWCHNILQEFKYYKIDVIL